MFFQTYQGEDIIIGDLIAVLSSEEKSQGFLQPKGVGDRPKHVTGNSG